MSLLLEELRTRSPLHLGLLGTVAQHRMPCPSNADPGANDDNAEARMNADTDAAIAVIGRACRAVMRDPDAARDLLREAAAMLCEIADEVQT
jgi:pseudouridine-5'-phosphate glycosidase